MRKVAAWAGLPGMKRTNTNLIMLNPDIVGGGSRSLSRSASTGTGGGTKLTSRTVGDHRFTTSATARVMYLTLCSKKKRRLGIFVGIQKVCNSVLVKVGESDGGRSAPNWKTPSCSRNSIDGAAWLYRTWSGGTIP